MARSDIATEAHNTNGLNALKNFVMDIDGYIGLYSIQNGNEQLIDCLRSEVDASIQLNHRVLKVGKNESGRYRLNMMNGKGPETRDFDLVLVCLPHSWLATMGWEGEELRKSMVKHVAYFDRPAHYLRVSILFDEPFWGEKISGAWFMSEAFGGCCVYNEGARHDVGKHGVLNWLIAGSDALAFANLSRSGIDRRRAEIAAGLARRRPRAFHGRQDPSLAVVGERAAGRTAGARCHDQSPPRAEAASGAGRGRRLSVRLHAQRPARLLRRRDRHHPDRDDAAAPRARAGRQAGARTRSTATISHNYRGLGPYSEVWRHFTDPDYLKELIRIVWGKSKGYKLLVAGSASGELVGALRERGIDAWGIENNRGIHAKTPKALKKYNKLGSIVDMPFKDGEFDFVFETSLCHVAKKQAARAIREINRVVATGVMFGSITSDMAPALIDRYDLLRGVKKLGTWWEWSELFFGNGFDLAMHRNDCTGRDLGRDACRQQGAGAVVRRRRQPALLLLRQGRRRGRRLGVLRRVHSSDLFRCSWP